MAYCVRRRLGEYQHLLTLSGLDEKQADRLLEDRTGLDGIPGTKDDGFQAVEQALSYARLPGDTVNLFSLPSDGGRASLE